MDLGVRGEVDDDVDLRILDPADPSRERRVMPSKVLQEGGKRVRPRVLALVDAEDRVALAKQPQPEVRSNLPARACDQDAHALTAFSAGRNRFAARRPNGKRGRALRQQRSAQPEEDEQSRT